MANDLQPGPVPPAGSPGRGAGRPSADSTSDATRLLCAGTYLNPTYRATVIRELLTHRFRVVAPSYGYDAVPVLAHALAARRLHRMRLGAFAAGAAVTLFLMGTGVLGGMAATVIVLWLLWATAFLRRVVTLQVLTSQLAPRDGTAGRQGGFDGSYPRHPELTSDLVSKILREQASDGSQICYGGYKPFVGAGTRVRRWSTAELLIGAPLTVFDGTATTGMPAPPGVAGRTAPGAASGTNGQEPRRKDVVPFTADDLSDYVSERLTAELRDRVREAQRVEGLTVERSVFTTAVTTLPGTHTAVPDQADGRWDDTYGSGRGYLCVRIGTWDQELVTTAFVGFDIKGSTLHTEFYSYVLGPIQSGFHLVDRLPGRLDGMTLVKVGWHTLRAAPKGTLRAAPFSALKGLAPWSRNRIELPQSADSSEFGLGRYSDTVVNRGALTSVRELATSASFHVFFQETDTIKYTQIVERQLLQAVRDFLHDHHVDLAEHEARQTNILNDYGSNNSFVNGSNNTTNSGTQHFGSGGPRTGSA